MCAVGVVTVIHAVISPVTSDRGNAAGMLPAPFGPMILAPKYLPRVAATVGLFTRYGLLDFAKGQGLLSLGGAAAGDGKPQHDGAGSEDKATAFKNRLIELGPAYIKLGQVLSTRPDLLPQSYIRELEHLQDSVEPMPFSDVRDTVESELHAGLNKLFLTFEDEPLGSASLGQVHAAQLSLIHI